MLKKPDFCKDCVLYGNGEGFITDEGTCSNGVLIVGESAGWGEIHEALPFRPSQPAGSILHRCIQRARLDRSAFGISNLIQCQPPHNQLLGMPYEYHSINKCRNFLDGYIKKFNPKVIFATGGLVFKHLVGLEGQKLNIQSIRGYIFRSSRYPSCLVLPTYHSSYLRRGNLHLMGTYLNDLIRSTYLASGKLVEGIDYILDPLSYNLNYITEPTLEDALNFLQNVIDTPMAIIAYDIETNKSIGEEEDEFEDYDSNITQIQFSIDKYSGIAFPFVEPFVTIAKQILATANTKIGWNSGDFDSPILKKSGFTINGENIDLMWAFHSFQADSPLGLQYCASFSGFPFPWKHMASSNLAFYGICDVTSLHYLYEYLQKQLKDRNMWEGYWNYVHKLKPILVDIQDRGLPINVSKQTTFGLEIDTRKIEILEELQSLIPTNFEKLNKVEGYKRVPKEVEQAKLKYMLEKGTTVVDVPTSYITEQTGFVLRDFIVGDKFTEQEEELIRMGVSFVDKKASIERRWVKTVEFNPNSVDDISNVIKLNGHEDLAKKLTVKIGKEYDEDIVGKKDNLSTSKTLLKKLGEKTGNSIYKLIIEYKELGKMKGTYIDGYKPTTKTYICSKCKGKGEIVTVYPTNLVAGEVGDYSNPKSIMIPSIVDIKESIKCYKCSGKGTWYDSRVHSTFTFRPSSGQLSSRNPNIQNYPIHSKLAEKFKDCIEAREGHVLASLDYRGFHNKMMGFLAQDPIYLRIASLDTHSFVTGHVVGFPNIDRCLELSDEELVIYLDKIKKQYKKLRDDQIKHVVHGINFGLSEEGCYKRYLEEFNPTQGQVLIGKRKNYDAEGIAKLIEQAGKKKVKEVYNIVKGLFPRIFEWQSRTIIEADQKGYIQTPFGARRWFFAASEIKYDRFGNVVKHSKGEQAEQALAFPVSNNSHYHMRQSMLLLEEAGYNRKYNLVNMIHDSLVFEPKREDLDRCIKDVAMIMERRSDVLKNEIMIDGFFCNVDCKVGITMAKMEEVKL